MFFIDVFKFYRNIYRNLTKIYVFSVGLIVQKRQKNHNNHVLIFEFYNANFNDIFDDFQIDIKTFDRDCVLKIKEMNCLI